MKPTVLDVRNLRTYFHTPRGVVKAVDDVSFNLVQGERFGLVGESGSGKTTVALSLLRMIKPPGQIEGGQLLLDGQDILQLSDEEMRRVRLAGIALVTQGSMNALNPISSCVYGCLGSLTTLLTSPTSVTEPEYITTIF